MTLHLKNNEITALPAGRRRCRPMLGTFVEIAVDHVEELSAHRAITAAFAEVERIQKLMSFYDVQSEVSTLNRLAMHESIQVSPETYQVLKAALEFYEITQGVFDITIGSELINEGILPKHHFLYKEYQATAEDIVLESDHCVRFLKPVCIDLGGIAKGFAVDRAVKVLLEQGIQNGLVNAGGDIRIFGSWKQPVWIKHSFRLDNVLDYPIVLENAAVATSTIRMDGEHSHLSPALHIQMPSRNILSEEKTVSIIAQECMWADALTKVVLSADQGITKKCLTVYQAKALVFDSDGEQPREIYYTGS